jgi:hypothetical protein
VSGITGRTYLERGRPVVIVTRWAGKGPRNVAVRREDGSVVVRPFRGLRKIQAGSAQPDPAAPAAPRDPQDRRCAQCRGGWHCLGETIPCVCRCCQ